MRSPIRKSIRYKIILPVILVLSSVLTLLVATSYLAIARLVTQYARESVLNQVRYAGNRVDGHILANSKIVEDLGAVVELSYATPAPEAEMHRFVKKWLLTHPDLSGFWFNSDISYNNQGAVDVWYTFKADGRATANPVSPEVHNSQNDGHPDYDFFYGAKRDGKMHFTPPYFDPTINVAMLSVTLPVYDAQKRFMGVCGVDMELSYIQKIVSEIKVSPTSYSLLISKEGTIIYHPDASVQMKPLEILKTKDEELLQVANQALRQKDAIQEGARSGQSFLYISTVVPTTGWIIISVVPEREVTGVLNKVLLATIAGLVIAIFLIGIFLIIIVSRLLVPIATLTEGASVIGSGNLNHVIEIKSQDELGELANRFNQMTTQIRDFTANLEDMVKLRTGELRNVMEQRSAFFQNISHELRTPLTLILGPLETSLRSESSLSEEDRVMMYSNARRLQRLVNQLLDLQKIEAKRMTVDPRPVDLGKFLEMEHQIHAPYARSRDISLVLEVPKTAPLAYADQDALDKCVSNYLSNSLKFTPSGGRIALRLIPLESTLRVEVEDNGVGVPDDKQHHLFQKFGYSEPGLTRKQEGSGLGLSLVSELIELHGGRTGFEKRIGGGSIFYFTVPQAPPGAEAAELLHVGHVGLTDSQRNQRQTDETQAPESGPTANRARVLVIDDTKDLRAYMARILEQAGFETEQAENGHKGLQLLSSEPVDLVITDLMMPEVSGIDVIKEIRKNSLLRTLPVILLTARAGDETRQEVREAGADVCLTKPFHDLEMIAAVKNLLWLKSREKVLARELSIARQLQRNLLPEDLPQTDRFRLGARLLPFEQVAGDLFDVNSLSDGRLAVFVGDVTGHGVSSAMISAMIKLAFHTACPGSADARTILERMNSLLFGRTGGLLASAVVAVLDDKRSRLDSAYAGHPPVIFCRNGKCSYREGGGLLLCAEPTGVVWSEILDLERGDRIIIYTDGVVDTCDPQKRFFGEDALASIVGSTLGFPIQQQIDLIVDSLETFRADAERRDDTTLLGIDFL